MIIRLKLVGTNDETNITIDKDEVSVIDIFNYLMENDLSYDEVSKLMFIHNGKNISNDTNYKLNDYNIIHIFVNDIHINYPIILQEYQKEGDILFEFNKLIIKENGKKQINSPHNLNEPGFHYENKL